MFCKNCGTPIPEGAGFCPNCGTAAAVETPSEPQENTVIQEAAPIAENNVAPVEASVPETPVQEAAPMPENANFAPATPIPEQAPDMNGFSFEPQPAKPKKKKILWGSIGVAAVAVITAVVLFVTGVFGGSPKKVLIKSEKKATASLCDALSSGKSVFEDHAVSASLELELSDECASMIGEIAGMDISGGSIGLDYDMVLDNGKAGINAELTADGEKLISADVVFDIQALTFYATIPELSSKSVFLDLKDFIDSDNLASGIQEYSGMINTLELIQYKLPDPEKITGILDDAFEAAINAIDDIKESKATLEANGVSQKCKKYDLTLTEKTLYKAAKAALKEISNNKDFKAILNDFGEIDEFAEVTEQLDSGIDMLVSQLDAMIKEADDSKDECVLLTFWIDDDEIIGFELGMKDDGKTAQMLKLACAQSGKDCGFIFVVNEDDESEICKVAGEGKKKDDLFTGTFTVEVQGETYAVLEMENFGVKKETLTGSLGISLGKEIVDEIGVPSEYASLLSSAQLFFEFEGSKDEQSVTAAIKVNNVKWISLLATVKLKDKYAVTVPTDLVKISSASDLEDWASTIDPEKTQALLEKAMNTKLLGSIVNAAVNAQVNSALTDDYSDYEDFDW